MFQTIMIANDDGRATGLNSALKNFLLPDGMATIILFKTPASFMQPKDGLLVHLDSFQGCFGRKHLCYLVVLTMTMPITGIEPSYGVGRK